MLPTPGQIVRARSRQYLVEDVLPPPRPADSTLVRLSCLDDDAQGEPLEILWEREVDAAVVEPSAWGRVVDRGFDAPKVFASYLNALRWNCVTATNPRLLQSPYRAGIEVMAYQLEPLQKALHLPRVNLFIADDVGLGKTIEAGLITRELLMRQKVRRVVVACPPSVVTQWQGELEQRFGLRFVVLDRDYVTQKRRERGYGVNPWATHTRFVVSHALLRDEAYAAPLRDWLAQGEDPKQPRGTLLILDEAHNAAPASSAKYAVDSRFTRVIRELAPLFEHRLFLSATPHNGHSNSFSALLEILDPQRFCRGVPVTPKALATVMVRRLKGDLREVGIAFPARLVVQLDVAGLPDDAPDLVLPRLLDEYRELREAKTADASRSARNAASLVVTALQKRLLSSIEAFASTLAVHRRTIERKANAGAGDARANARQSSKAAAFDDRQTTLLDPVGADDERADDAEADVRAEEEAELAAATEVAMTAAGLELRERQLLDEMTTIAEQARSDPDARVKRLIQWVRAECIEADGVTWKPRRLLIFTEYSDTKRYLDEQLRSAFARTNDADARVATFHGGMDDETRTAIKDSFNRDPQRDPLRILIATDAAREGVNLQNHCADLFHFDVPWNPSRMEQRNGRIDRKLQRAPEVRCHYFVYSQRPEDRVLETLVRKTKNIHSELGSLGQVLEARIGRHLDSGIRRRDAAQLVRSIDAEQLDSDKRGVVDSEMEATTRKRQKALIEQNAALRVDLDAAQKHLGFDEHKFRTALSCSLELQRLKPLEDVPGEPGVVQLAADDPRMKADPTWTETLDTLRRPRRPEENPWEWRKLAPVRPIVFRDLGSLDDDKVHMHLEHRFAQRLLGRFLAQGFVHDDLARACVAYSDEPIARVVLLGRLSLYGDRAARLHDQLIAVAARWDDPLVRKAPLKPYADDTKRDVLRLLDEALLEGHIAPLTTQKKLAAAVERDVRELIAPLNDVGEQGAKRAEEMLVARGAKEAKDMVEVLELQAARIGALLGEKDAGQLTFGFSDDERRQLEADQRHWKKRAGEIAGELATEPAGIVASYATRARRIEPVGLVYLWPRSG